MPRSLVTVFVFVLLQCAIPCMASKTQAPATPASQEVLQAEIDQLRTENDRLLKLIEKLEQKPAEKSPDRTPLWALFATATLGVATLGWNAWNASKQAELQSKLKALDVVVGANGPESARDRLRIVENMLGGELFDALLKDEPLKGMGSGHNENRKALISMLMEYPNQRGEVLQLWKTLFPKGGLALDLQRLETSLGPSQVAATPPQQNPQPQPEEQMAAEPEPSAAEEPRTP
jgi:hypothetical protein